MDELNNEQSELAKSFFENLLAESGIEDDEVESIELVNTNQESEKKQTH